MIPQERGTGNGTLTSKESGIPSSQEELGQGRVNLLIVLCKLFLCLTPFAINIISATVGFLTSLLFSVNSSYVCSQSFHFCFHLEKERE